MQFDYSYATNMSFLCHPYVLVCHPRATRMYPYVMVCYLYVLICHLYVTYMFLYVIGMSLVCTCMSSYVTHMYSMSSVRLSNVLVYRWFYNELLIGSVTVMVLYDHEAKRSFFHTICLLHWSKQFRNKLKYKSSSYIANNPKVLQITWKSYETLAQCL